MPKKRFRLMTATEGDEQTESSLFHGFIKKTQKTPKADLELALSRKRDLEERE
jgi:phage-related protein